MKTTLNSSSLYPALRNSRWVMLTLAAMALTVQAAPASISSVPLSTATVTVKPNLMFILDDSGSMERAYMPDDMPATNRNGDYYYGYFSSQCNGLAFNPNLTYPLPLRADGTSYPAITNFASAPTDGFDASSSRANLTGSQYYRYTGTQPAMSWLYTESGVTTSATFYRECRSLIGNSPGSGVFTLTSVSVAQQQNYANWYAYYRTRQLLMRSAVGTAFRTLNDDYRVGFTVISDSGVTGSRFINVSDFNSAQKTSFYDALYGAPAASFTPLRASLSKVGRYFANRFTGQTDPIQYACQRNYALLSTDGYWNNDTETNTYGPLALDGSTAVGQQDGTEARPMWDGFSSTVTATTPTTTVRREQAVTRRSVPTTSVRYRWVTGNSTTSNISIYQETRTRTVVTDTTVVSDITSVSTRTVVTTNGAVTSDQTTTSSSSAPVSTNAVVVSDNTTAWASGSASTRSLTTTRFNNSGLTTNGTYYSNSCNSGTGNSTVGSGSCGFTTTPTAGNNTTGSTTVTGPTTTVLSTNGPTVGTTTTSAPVVSGGASNSLADVAQYYYATDLRTDHSDNVRTTTADPATHQHMNTFTVGLGVQGTLTYDRNYLTQTSGDYVNLRNGSRIWPVPAGTVGGGENATHIDDLWHAAVNGRGQYFSATDPTTLADALATTLRRVTEASGAGAAAAASTLTPITGDDWVFLPTYSNAPTWNGDLRAYKFTFSPTGDVIPPDTTDGNELWSARSMLESRTTARRVLFNNRGTLAAFTYANVTSAGLNGNFDNLCATAAPRLSQCSELTTAQLANVTGTNAVNFLAGDRSMHMSQTNGPFRTRAFLLGDMMNAAPIYVGRPPFKYTDSMYASFVSGTASNRTKVIYAAANDGMIHAFRVAEDGTGGTELWSYIPTAVMPDLWRLADRNYEANHRYYVDGSPTMADVFDGTAWRTILVGGMGGGGRGYYALDITVPESPVLLWEFSDANLGLTYGNPVVSKTTAAIGATPANTWTVAFTSGYNNISPGDGRGRVFVRNAITGAEVITLDTGVGNTTTPSNLGRLNAWLESDTNNRALRYYGGDMLGNLWRFDYANQVAPSGSEAFLLARAVNASGDAQPITVKPMLSEVQAGGSPVAVISFGTGRYLGNEDLTDETVQSVYAVKDALTATGLGNLQSTAANLVQQTLDTTRHVATANRVDWASNNGWYINLNQSARERVHVDGTPLEEGVLAFSSTVPTGNACDLGGRGYLYQLSLTEGDVLQVDSFNAVVVGLSRVINPNGSISAVVTTQNQRLSTPKSVPGRSSSPGNGAVQRTTWRELVD